MSFINKERNVIDFALASLWRRRAKTLLLLLVYAGVIFVLASVMFFTGAIKHEARALLAGSPEVLVQRMSAGRHEMAPQRYLDTLRDIRGVREATGRLWGYYYDPAVGANYTVVAQPQDSFAHKPGEVAVGSALARARLVAVGDLFPFRAYDGSSVPLKIVSVLDENTELVAADLVVMSEGDFRKLFGTPEGLYTDIALTVRNERERATVARKITEALPDARPIVREEILRTYDALFHWRGGLMLLALSAAVLSFIILAWDKATGLSAEERREIGILKAIGWETADVLRMKLWEGALVSLGSTLAGCLGAYAHVFFASSVLFKPVLMGWSVLYPEFKLVPYVEAYSLFVVIFLAVVPYSIATVVPAWRAATVDPDSIMRQ